MTVKRIFRLLSFETVREIRGKVDLADVQCLCDIRRFKLLTFFKSSMTPFIRGL